MPKRQFSFNSRLVRLKDDLYAHISALDSGFNSRLVRLKDDFETYNDICEDRFQFQIVRLKAGLRKNIYFAERDVSIPDWCD